MFPLQADRAFIPARGGSGEHLNAKIFPTLTFRKAVSAAPCGTATVQCMMGLNRLFPVLENERAGSAEPEMK